MSNQAVYGIISNRAKAEQIVQKLLDAGISRNDISFLSSQTNEFSDYNNDTYTSNLDTNERNWRTEERLPGSQTSTNYDTQQRNASAYTNQNYKNERTHGDLGTEKHTKAPEGTATGATTGGLIGGVLGLLAGIGALAIPGVGPFVAAGPILATLSGLGAGALTGGIIGALVGAGIPEYEAKRYESNLKKGGILISVRALNSNTATQVKDILTKNGTEDVTVSSESSATASGSKASHK